MTSGTVPPPWINMEMVSLVPWVLVCLGYPERALQVGRAVLDMFQREKTRVQRGIEFEVICVAMCAPHQLLGQVKGVQEGLEMLNPLLENHRDCPSFPNVALYQGWVKTQCGALEQGIAEMQQGLASFPQYTMVMPHDKALLGEALGHAGHIEEGLRLLEEALEQTERTGERWSEAELWRIKGELLLQRPSSPAQSPSSPGQSPSSPALLPRLLWEKGEEAEVCFRRAIEVARGQAARSWELRATASLARLLRGQGRAAEAREMLAAIYGWFTEGFDTPDLVEAKGLLEALNR